MILYNIIFNDEYPNDDIILVFFDIQQVQIHNEYFDQTGNTGPWSLSHTYHDHSLSLYIASLDFSSTSGNTTKLNIELSMLVKGLFI